MISMFVALMLQASAPTPAAPAPQSPPCRRGKACRARARLGSLISNDDYTKDALRNNEQGTVGFRVEVGADGLVKACNVTATSGSASLDSATCRLLTERARFTPAYNKRGKPVPDSVAARIVWRIDASKQLPPLAPGLFAATMRVSPEGEMSCTYAENGQAPATMECPATGDQGMIAAARARGRSVEQTFVRSITPDGKAEPVDTVDHGTQVVAAEALLSVAADGSLLECRVLRNETLGPVAGRPVPSTPCDDFTVGEPAFRPLTGAEHPATVRLRIRMYMRT